MAKNFQKTLLLVTILATFASGCRSTDDYKKFAEAGNNFAKANNELLNSAEKMAVNTTSERMLSDRIIKGEPELNIKDRDNFTRRYEENFSKSDIERLELIKELRNHNRLLFTYFNTLLKLAGSDSSVRTQTAVTSIANQLQDSGNRLISLGNLGKLPSVTGIVLDARIRGTIRGELEKRKESIYREITIQEKLLKVIGNSMEDDAKVTRQLQEYRLVLLPLFESLDKIKQDDWLEKRYEVMTQDSKVIDQINEASGNLAEFREMFIASVGGEVTSKQINTFVRKTNSFSKEIVVNKP